MSDTASAAPARASAAWTLFTYMNFGIAALMMAGGIYFLEASFSTKGFYAMAALMLVNSTAAITKSVRDREEATRLHNKLEEAHTERLLMEVSTPKGL
ncbi:YiaA/YiaB family inner membrane protein [Rhodobacter sp. NSM]|uniref:YiaA/YiaB family inner membrane protein n=1 Tax=Rhodobacter sp. NSM TaxID=3457501 RepID=UPI003FD4A384